MPGALSVAHSAPGSYSPVMTGAPGMMNARKKDHPAR